MDTNYYGELNPSMREVLWWLFFTVGFNAERFEYNSNINNTSTNGIAYMPSIGLGFDFPVGKWDINFGYVFTYYKIAVVSG